MHDEAGVPPVGGADGGGAVRHRDRELTQLRVHQDRARCGRPVRARPLGSHPGSQVRLDRDRRFTGRERPADTDRIGMPDQVRRAVLVGPGSAEIDGVRVVADAFTGIVFQGVHRPARRNLNRITAVGHGFHGRRRGPGGLGGFVGFDRLDGRFLRYGLNGRGKLHIRNDMRMPAWQNDSPERAPEHYCHCRATH
jgi:hypothetical protein